jgi:hypothetical protein
MHSGDTGNTMPNTESKYKHGCLMVKVSVEKWDGYLEMIGEENLYINENDPSYGFVETPHVSILYGLDDDCSDTYMEQVKQFVENIKCELKDGIQISTSQISIFDKAEEYDVVKFDAESDVLHVLNTMMRNTFPHTEYFKDYHPHITIAYVKAGKGKDYIQQLPQTVVFKSDMLVYSRPDKSQIEFKLC